MPTKDLARRAVVTGLGAVTPIGNTAKAYWENLIAGTSGVDPISCLIPPGWTCESRPRSRDSTQPP